MGLYCFLFLDGLVGTGVCSILDMADPWADILATGGYCFVCWGRSECLGVECFFCLGFGFYSGGKKYLSGKNLPSGSDLF